MDGTFEIAKPNEIKATLHLTMTIGDWKELREQLVKKWPGSRLSSMITDLVFQAEKTFFEENEVEERYDRGIQENS